MDYSIQQLESQINEFERATDVKRISDQIKHTVYTISEGNRLTQHQARKLESIINCINSDQALKWVVPEFLRRKLWESIYRSREETALSFYASHGKDSKEASGINFRHDVYKGVIPQGTILFQWCRVWSVNGSASLINPRTGKTTVGEYFCYSKVPQEQLGINPYSDVCDASGDYEGTTNRLCYKFRFPFKADCLLSSAKGTYDNWSVLQRNGAGNPKRNSSGQLLGSPRWAVGGQQQIYIPLNFQQRMTLAQIAQPS